MITQFLRYASLALIYLTTFIPLYVANSLFFPFITGKAFAFRIIVEILFVCWLLLMLRDKKYAPRFSWISTTITAFVIVIFIADLLGLNVLRSLWSNFERMEGWVTLIHLWAFFIATTGIFGSGEEGRRMWHNLFKTSLVAAAITGIYGFFQLFGWAAIHQGSSRIDASLGNAAYMAVYMLIHTFMAFYLGLVAHERQNKGMTWFYVILGAIFAFLLFETSTRGTIIGLVGGVMLGLGIFAVFGKEESKKLRLVAGGGIILLVLLSVGLVAAKNTALVQKSETLRRLASISLSAQGQARAYIWPMAVKGALETPKTAIIGVGQENFNYIFNTNYNPKMWNQEQWFDRAHSVYLDWLVAGGILGLVLYLSLFVLAIRGIWKSTISFKEKCLLTGLFVGYGIHNIFVFDNLASYILFFTMLGFVHSLVAQKSIRWFTIRDSQTENQVIVRDYIYFPVILILFIITFYCVNIRTIQANTRLIAAMVSCSGGGTPSAPLFSRALALNQSVANQEIREQLIACASQVIAGQTSNDQKSRFYTLTSEEIQKQIKANPNDARGYILGGSFFNNVGDWNNALPLVEKALQLSPNKQSIILELSNTYVNVGKENEALELLEKAYLSAPENENAKSAYGSLLVLTGNEAKAQELFKDKPEFWTDPRIVSIYVRTKQWNKAIDILSEQIKKDPNNLQYYASLASVYYQSGNIGMAIAELEIAKEKFPIQKAQIQATIDELRKVK